jgi:hypothetical protein
MPILIESVPAAWATRAMSKAPRARVVVVATVVVRRNSRRVRGWVELVFMRRGAVDVVE